MSARALSHPDGALEAEFRAGFHRRRRGRWLVGLSDESTNAAPDVSACLAEIQAGRRDFAYPRHDRDVYDLLTSLVRLRGLRLGADIGCATGCFPAMQLAAGIESVTVFEVRPIESNHPQVSVRVEDLTYADDVQPEFDLITCLSTIEHVGLGRYGDPIDPWGDVKLAVNLRRLLLPGGLLFLSFPVGIGSVVYNAHRIYSRHRRQLLFGELPVVATARGRSLLGQARHTFELVTRVRGASSQPIFVLEKPRQ